MPPQNPDNSVRKQAEETYNKAKESTQGKVVDRGCTSVRRVCDRLRNLTLDRPSQGMAAQELVKMMRSSQDLSVRSMAAVLLRRLLTK